MDRCGKLAAHESRVTAVAVSRDGKLMATGGDDRQVKLWRASSGERVAEFKFEATSGVADLAFSPDGTHLAVVTDDKALRLYRTTDGKLARTFTGHTGNVTTVAFTPNGANLVTGSSDRTVRVWNAATGQVVRQIKHTQAVTRIAVSPDGNVLASTEKNVVRLWGPREWDRNSQASRGRARRDRHCV